MVLVPCSVPQKCSSFQGSAAQMSLLADMCQPPWACTGAALLPNSESLKKKTQKTVTESKACASDPREWVRMGIASGGKEGMLPSELWEAGWVPCPFPGCVWLCWWNPRSLSKEDDSQHTQRVLLLQHGLVSTGSTLGPHGCFSCFFFLWRPGITTQIFKALFPFKLFLLCFPQADFKERKERSWTCCWRY